MPFISLPRRLIAVALILLGPVWTIIPFAAVSDISAAYAQTVTPTCPQGYSFSGGTCVRGAPAPSCPSGYVFSGGTCVVAASNGPWAFIVTRALSVGSALELDGAALCVVTGSRSEAAATRYFRTNGLNVELVNRGTIEFAISTYDRQACDVLVVDAALANATIDRLSRPNDHGILPERITGSGVASHSPNRPTIRPTATPRPTPVDLAMPLQRELKRIGCLRGAVDGIWGNGSRNALGRFARRAGLNLGREPSQTALNEARRRNRGFCPVRVAPKRKKRQGCRSGTVLLDGQCIPRSQVASFCGPGFERRGTKCVRMQDGGSGRCKLADYTTCNQKAREYCEGEDSDSCLNRESQQCLREEIGCNP